MKTAAIIIGFVAIAFMLFRPYLRKKLLEDDDMMMKAKKQNRPVAKIFKITANRKTKEN